MAIFSVPNVCIKGISACVPANSESNWDYTPISLKERELLIKTTGIACRRVATKEQCTSDMCMAAAERLMAELNWAKDSIDILIFVSQSQDYFLPATGIILQDRLGLPKNCLSFDIMLGCSGYVYGLSVMAGLLQNGHLKRGLLLVGDKSTFSLTPKDKSTYPLFGDAGTATAMAYDDDDKRGNASVMSFNLQSDGSGKEAIIIPDGATRSPINENTYIEQEIEPGVVRHRRNLWLDGMAVFNFTLREVTPNINELLQYLGRSTLDYDYFVFHQANKLMNESIRKKLKLPPEKVPYTLPKYGNTSSASIPLTIVSELSEQLSVGSHHLLLSAFGVGLSWGSASLDVHNLVCPPLIELQSVNV